MRQARPRGVDHLSGERLVSGDVGLGVEADGVIEQPCVSPEEPQPAPFAFDLAIDGLETPARLGVVGLAASGARAFSRYMGRGGYLRCSGVGTVRAGLMVVAV